MSSLSLPDVEESITAVGDSMLYSFYCVVNHRLTNKDYVARSQKCLKLSLLNSYAVRGEDIWGIINRLSVEKTAIPSISELSLCGDGFTLSKSTNKSRRLSSKKEEEEEEEEDQEMKNTIVIKNSFAKKPTVKSTSTSTSTSTTSSTTSTKTTSISSMNSGSNFRGSDSLYNSIFNSMRQDAKAEEETESFDEAYLLNRLRSKRKEDEIEEMNKLQDVVTNINNGYLKTKTKFNSIILLFLHILKKKNKQKLTQIFIIFGLV